MVQLSEGLSAFSMIGIAAMPRAGSSVIFWSVYALAVFAYARHTRILRDWCWVLPGVVLWFGYRALMSYWYFFALLAVAALMTSAQQLPVGSGAADHDEHAERRRSWLPTGIAAALTAVGIAGFLVWCALRPAPFHMFLYGATDAWELRAFRLRVRVENRLGRAALPQFSLQSTGLQPLAWIIERGPRELLPGQSAEYEIRAPRMFNEFDVTEAARLEVHDRRDPGRKAFLTISGERSLKLPDAVPNPDFHVVETRTAAPTGWSFTSPEGGAALRLARTLDARARVAFDFPVDGPSSAVRADFARCVVSQHLGEVTAGGRSALLSTVLPLPDGPITMNVVVPAAANIAPYDTLYGVVLAVPHFRVHVLFGEDVPRGTLPSGELFTSIPVTRGAWTSIALSPRAILERLQAPLYQVRHRYLRAPSLDFPSTPLELGLFAHAPPGQELVAEFGRIEQADVRPTRQLFDQPSPAGFAVWRAELDLENGNFAKGARNLERANELEPTRDRLVRLGDAYMLDKNFASARDAYSRVPAGDAEVELGLGSALLELGELDLATQQLERARDAYKESEKAPPRERYLDALRGLVVVSARKNDCEAARRYRDEVVAETPSVPPPSVSPCP
jgi:hypothetical protein